MIVGLGVGAGTMGSSFFTEIDRTGARLRIQAFGCETWSIDLAVAHQGSRDPVIVSTVDGALDLGKGIRPPAGATDLLVARLPAL